MRRVQRFGAGLSLVVLAGAMACQENQSSSGAAASASASASPAPSAKASASAAPSAEAPSSAALAEADEKLSMEVKTEHRQHHTGFAGLVGMAVETLGASNEQAAALDKVRENFEKKMKPIREADSKVDTVLADGVAAGAIDKAKVDAAVAAAVAAAANAHADVDDELNELHAALRPEQRAALVDKVAAEWTLWKEANALDQAAEAANPKGHLEHFAKKFALTEDQVAKARAALDASKEAKASFDPAAVDAHMKAFSTDFVADKFDAKKLPRVENGRLVSWSATRSARFYEAVTPILTPEQRTKVAEELREHVNEWNEEGKP